MYLCGVKHKLIITKMDIIKNNRCFVKNNFKNADLENSNLVNANFRSSDFRNANLRNVNMENANLENSDFENANLRNANLRGSNLRNANFRNANLRNVDLEYANLKNVKNIFIFNKENGRTCYAIRHENNILMIKAGCFWGTLEEFEIKDVLKSYSKQIDYLKTL